jgi:hypothetical protein
MGAGTQLTRYARLFAPEAEIEYVLPMQAGDPEPVRWRFRMMRSRDFRLSIALDRSSRTAREAGKLPSVNEVAHEIDRQREVVVAHVSGVLVPPSASWIVDRAEIARLVASMTPAAYTELESALMGSAEISPLEKA